MLSMTTFFQDEKHTLKNGYVILNGTKWNEESSSIGMKILIVFARLASADRLLLTYLPNSLFYS